MAKATGTLIEKSMRSKIIPIMPAVTGSISFYLLHAAICVNGIDKYGRYAGNGYAVNKRGNRYVLGKGSFL
jgi:hypothetical protein